MANQGAQMMQLEPGLELGANAGEILAARRGLYSDPEGVLRVADRRDQVRLDQSRRKAQDRGGLAYQRYAVTQTSSTPLCATGPSTVSIYDIHALQEQFYFGDAVHAQLKSALGLLLTRIEQLASVAAGFNTSGAADVPELLHNRDVLRRAFARHEARCCGC